MVVCAPGSAERNADSQKFQVLIEVLNRILFLSLAAKAYLVLHSSMLASIQQVL